MPVAQTRFPSQLPIPLQLDLSLLRQPAKLLQPVLHLVVDPPPPPVCHVARVDPLLPEIPIAIVVPIALPRLQAEVVYGIQLRRVRPEKLVLHVGLA